MRSISRPLGFAALALLVLAAVAAAAAPLHKVEAKYVCMVNNKLFAEEQIAVEVEEKTYYGCCEMCKERLANDAAARHAVDPITGAKVDKASAVIGADEKGNVFYFENEANLEKANAG